MIAERMFFYSILDAQATRVSRPPDFGFVTRKPQSCADKEKPGASRPSAGHEAKQKSPALLPGHFPIPLLGARAVAARGLSRLFVEKARGAQIFQG